MRSWRRTLITLIRAWTRTREADQFLEASRTHEAVSAKSVGYTVGYCSKQRATQCVVKSPRMLVILLYSVAPCMHGLYVSDLAEQGKVIVISYALTTGVGYVCHSRAAKMHDVCASGFMGCAW